MNMGCTLIEKVPQMGVSLIEYLKYLWWLFCYNLREIKVLIWGLIL